MKQHQFFGTLSSCLHPPERLIWDPKAASACCVLRFARALPDTECLCADWERVQIWGHVPGEGTLWALIQERGSSWAVCAQLDSMIIPPLRGCPRGSKKRRGKQGPPRTQLRDDFGVEPDPHTPTQPLKGCSLRHNHQKALKRVQILLLLYQ